MHHQSIHYLEFPVSSFIFENSGQQISNQRVSEGELFQKTAGAGPVHYDFNDNFNCYGNTCIIFSFHTYFSSSYLF